MNTNILNTQKNRSYNSDIKQISIQKKLIDNEGQIIILKAVIHNCRNKSY